MDEEDGRPGHVAPQSGHLDAPKGVPMVSLSRLNPISSFTEILSEIERRSESARHLPKQSCVSALRGPYTPKVLQYQGETR